MHNCGQLCLHGRIEHLFLEFGMGFEKSDIDEAPLRLTLWNIHVASRIANTNHSIM